MIKSNKDVLLDLYNNFAESINPGEPKVMRLGSFTEMIIKSNVIHDETFGERDIGTMVNLAMMTQINEIHSSRHLNMQFIEFVEAIARIADKVYSVRKDLLTQANSIQNTIKRTRTKDKVVYRAD